MCELMGLSLSRAASASFSFREFAARDVQNMDGWGLAWYPDRSAALVKEPVSWRASPHIEFLAKYPGVLSSIYIAHVRHKTVGGKATHADTHPFLREFGGRDYVFAHNGTLKHLDAHFRPTRYLPVGETDSEFAFCCLLSRLARRGSHLTEPRYYRWLHRQLTQLNRFGQLNCLLSDGESLFAYHDSQGYKGLVWRTIANAGRQPGHFEDSEMQLSFESDRRVQGLVVATHPMGDSEWRAFEPGQLLVVRRGVVEYASQQRLPSRRATA